MFEYSEGPYARFSTTRGRISGVASPYGIAYPSPFFDLAHTYLPDTVKQMFRWCRYYYLTNPLIAAVVNKMAEYPITDLAIDHENAGLVDLWTDFFEDVIRLRPHMIDTGLYYSAYGNAICSISYPFVKYLRCRHCGKRVPARTAAYRFTNFRFILTCSGCGTHSDAEVEDVYVRTSRLIKLLLWNPEDITIKHNDLTGENEYYYTLPQGLRNDILLGKANIVEAIPQLFIDAVRLQKAIILSRENVFHLRRPSLLTGVKDSGWGIPLILPVLKDVFYLQVLKKAQESIALERVTPLNVVFPQPGSGAADPFSTINLSLWRDQVQAEIYRWRMDRNYIPILPLPIGSQIIGGDGRALLLTQEIRMWSEQIVAGMGVPAEFVWGGLSWSGSNVSLRMLENQFLRYIADLSRMIRWIVKNISTYLGWPEVPVRFKPFKMADDLQRKALLMQMNQAGKISDTSLLSDSDFDPVKEDKLMENETSRRLQAVRRQQLAQAELQGESQLIMSKYQARAQSIMNEEQMKAQAGQQNAAPGEAREAVAGPANPMLPAPTPPPLPAMVSGIVRHMHGMPPEQQSMMLQQIASQNPELSSAVADALKTQQQDVVSRSAGKALPPARPPRRGPGVASI